MTEFSFLGEISLKKAGLTRTKPKLVDLIFVAGKSLLAF